MHIVLLYLCTTYRKACIQIIVILKKIIKKRDETKDRKIKNSGSSVYSSWSDIVVICMIYMYGNCLRSSEHTIYDIFRMKQKQKTGENYNYFSGWKICLICKQIVCILNWDFICLGDSITEVTGLVESSVIY